MVEEKNPLNSLIARLHASLRNRGCAVEYPTLKLRLLTIPHFRSINNRY